MVKWILWLLVVSTVALRADLPSGEDLIRKIAARDKELVQRRRAFDYDIAGWESHYVPGAERVHVECFLAEAPGGWEPTLDWEHDAYRWCLAGEAAALFYWPEPRELLEGLAAA